MNQDRGTVRCLECSEIHPAEYSHDSQADGKRIYEVACPRTGQTDDYTADAVTFRS